MPAKYVRAFTSREIPDPYSAISGPTDKGILAGGKRPHTAFMAVQDLQEFTRQRRIHVNGMIIGCRYDAPVGEK
jgi:hypothetical protein